MTDVMVTERQQETFSRKVSLQNLGSVNICVFCFLFLRSFCVEARREEMRGQENSACTEANSPRKPEGSGFRGVC